MAMLIIFSISEESQWRRGGYSTAGVVPPFSECTATSHLLPPNAAPVNPGFEG